jgi:hypothetical protein
MSASFPIPSHPSSEMDHLQLDHPLARAFASFTEAASSGALSLD